MTVVRNLRFFVIIYLALNHWMALVGSDGSVEQNICMTEKCIRTAADILQKMDKTVDPCDDFYKFTCGNFVKKVITPDYKVFFSPDSTDKIMSQLVNLFEDPIRDDDSKALKILKTIYNSCMDTSRIQQGLHILKREFKELGGWPVLEPHWNEDNFDWKDFKQDFSKTYFFRMYTSTDFKNSSRTILTITQKNMDYSNLKEGFNNTAVKASYHYVVELAVLFGADRETAASDMTDVINFEADLARIVIPHKDEEKYILNYNLVTIYELQNYFSNIPWLKLINSYLSPAAEMTLYDVVNFKTPKYFERLNTFLVNTKKRILANYLFAQLAKDAADYLPEVFRQKKTEYLTTVFGKDMSTPRWKYCGWEAVKLNYIAVSSVYLKNICYENTKNIVKEQTTDLKNSLLDVLKEINWMDVKTKEHALLKAEMMEFFTYPDEILDDKKVNDYYKKLEVDPNGSYYGVSVNVSKFRHMKDAQKLKEPVNKADWTTRGYTFYVANYVQNENSFELPASLIQNNFDPGRPQYMNYGALGQAIGHLITHGFDEEGKQYDKDGNSNDWWESETSITFNNESQCFIDQYGNYTILEVEDDVYLSHIFSPSVSEHIADNGGIKIAYRAYMKWLERNKPESLLPGLPYTQHQLFWISAALSWCDRYKRESYKRIDFSKHNAPKYIRFVLPFMNSEYFGKDFKCPLGSPMNPENKCSVW